MKVDQVLSTARDSLTVRRVFGDPVTQGHITVIPAARVSGGAGGGAGHDPGRGDGEGGGFGVNARPVGAYVIRDGVVRWRPAIDVNRVLGALAAVLITALVTQSRSARVHEKAQIARALITRPPSARAARPARRRRNRAPRTPR